jgi:prepilin signal peptidase PulO-like enzyme (type II secretory pathway)
MTSHAADAAPGRLRRVIAWLVKVTVDNAGGAVYGTIMIGVLFAAEDAESIGYTDAVAAAVIVLVLYWLTNLYTYTLGTRLRTGEPLSAAVFWRSLVHELPIVEGALVPLLVLLGAWAAGASVATGVGIATWATAVSIVVLEFAAGWRSGLGRGRLLLQAVIGAAIGFALVGLRLLLH